MLAEASKSAVAKDQKYKKSNFLISPGIQCFILRVIDIIPLLSFEIILVSGKNGESYSM